MLGKERLLEEMTRGAVGVSADGYGSCVLRLRDGRVVQVARFPVWRTFLRMFASRARLLFFQREDIGDGSTLMGDWCEIRVIDETKSTAAGPLRPRTS